MRQFSSMHTITALFSIFLIMAWKVRANKAVGAQSCDVSPRVTVFQAADLLMTGFVSGSDLQVVRANQVCLASLYIINSSTVTHTLL
jgi:hypothetical protein